MSEPCPLCLHSKSTFYSEDKRRAYYQCELCQLVFVARSQLISLEQEKQIYDSHENDVNDAGYQKFLSRALTPLLPELAEASLGLDFGCGPGPALAKMLTEKGHATALYDIFYYPNTEALNRQYDFVTCTEVIEHLANPNEVWAQLLNLLKPNGVLVVMTKLVIDQARFKNWHYKNDITHINFFSRATFDYLAQHHGLSLTYHGDDVMLFKQSAIV
ncbi:class I SAM-dependent methyltransferase [Pseudoalteromonas sp. T1lg24]|uniref:class I SAM-dependent methyltransferase n=1 Tax=Pseudoalteromonas sp. T1lg24 TaxID=2077099 RepID=UPI000CF648CF|nr:class I SAM-dependent methyltransferase [Pseudoalteromonas sp. T1lg24]